MAFRVLAVFLVTFLVAVAEESTRLTTEHRLCLCEDHAIGVQVVDDKESSSVSCKEQCRAINNKDVTWSGQRRRKRTLLEQSPEEQVCHEMVKSDPRFIIKNVNVTFLRGVKRPYSNVSDWYIEVSWKPFTDLSERWSGYCVSYSARVGRVINSSFYPQNTTSIGITLGSEKQYMLLAVVVVPTDLQNEGEKEPILMQAYSGDVTWSGQVITHKRTLLEQSGADEVCRKMTYSHPRFIIRNVTVAFLRKVKTPNSNVSDWYVEVSWKPFTDPPERWSGYCVSYFAEAGRVINSSFYPQNTTSIGITLESEKPRMLLSVVVVPTDLQNEGEKEPILMQAYNGVSAKVDPTLAFTTTTKISAKVDPTLAFTTTTKRSSMKLLPLFISAGVMAGLVVCVLVHFLRRKKDNRPLPPDFKYHAFIIYNSEDAPWMKKKLLFFLEEKHHLTCCVHYRDFALGKPFRDNMADSVYKSYKVIVLFSNNFVNSNYCNYELDIALGRLVERRDNSLVVIRLDGADWVYLPEELKRRSCIDYYDTLERHLWKQKLLKFLDIPEGSRTESTSDEQSNDMDGNGNREKIRFNRLKSTTSNVSETIFSVRTA